MKAIIGLIGPSGAGKTTIILELLKLFPELKIMKSLTTRPKREPQDDLFYQFISKKELLDLHKQNRLTHISEYSDNFYSNDTKYLNDLLNVNVAIAALVQSGVIFLRNAGYKVKIINIIPVDTDFIRDIKRLKADQKRFKDNLPADLEIINSFKPGGLNKSVDQISDYIKTII